MAAVIIKIVPHQLYRHYNTLRCHAHAHGREHVVQADHSPLTGHHSSSSSSMSLAPILLMFSESSCCSRSITDMTSSMSPLSMARWRRWLRTPSDGDILARLFSVLDGTVGEEPGRVTVLGGTGGLLPLDFLLWFKQNRQETNKMITIMRKRQRSQSMISKLATSFTRNNGQAIHRKPNSWTQQNSPPLTLDSHIPLPQKMCEWLQWSLFTLPKKKKTYKVQQFHSSTQTIARL